VVFGCRRRCASATAALRAVAIVRQLRHLLRSRVFVGYCCRRLRFAGLFAFLAGSSFVFVQVLGKGERGIRLPLRRGHARQLTGATLGSRVVRRWGIDRTIRVARRGC
jgi:hypothetical protein